MARIYTIPHSNGTRMEFPDKGAAIKAAYDYLAANHVSDITITLLEVADAADPFWGQTETVITEATIPGPASVDIWLRDPKGSLV